MRSSDPTKSALGWFLAFCVVTTTHLQLTQANKLQATVTYTNSRCSGTPATISYAPVFVGEDAKCTTKTIANGPYHTQFGVYDPFSDAVARFKGQAFVTWAKLRSPKSSGIETVLAYSASGICQSLGVQGFRATITSNGASLTTYTDNRCDRVNNQLFEVNATSTRVGKQFTGQSKLGQWFARVYDATGQLQFFGTEDTEGDDAQYFEFTTPVTSAPASTNASSVSPPKNGVTTPTTTKPQPPSSSVRPSTMIPSQTPRLVPGYATTAPPLNPVFSSAATQVLTMSTMGLLVVAHAWIV